MRAREKDLQRRTVRLKAFNITLHTLLEQREVDRKEIERRIMTNIDDLIMPCVERLKSIALPKPAHLLVQNVQENLRALTSPLLSDMKAKAHLTPTELQIADYIKKGKELQADRGRHAALARAPSTSTGTDIRKKMGYSREENQPRHVSSGPVVKSPGRLLRIRRLNGFACNIPRGPERGTE